MLNVASVSFHTSLSSNIFSKNCVKCQVLMHTLQQIDLFVLYYFLAQKKSVRELIRKTPYVMSTQGCDYEGEKQTLKYSSRLTVVIYLPSLLRLIHIYSPFIYRVSFIIQNSTSIIYISEQCLCMFRAGTPFSASTESQIIENCELQTEMMMKTHCRTRQRVSRDLSGN